MKLVFVSLGVHRSLLRVSECKANMKESLLRRLEGCEPAFPM